MPYFNVYIDDDEILSDVSDKSLIKELERRNLRLGPETNRIAKRELLTEVSNFLRLSEKLGLAGRIDELMMELEI
jgi:hypothetical protein